MYMQEKNMEMYKRWALRTWSQIYASLFYRVSYYILKLCGYTVISVDDFKRPLDEFLNWWFFLAPLFLMELYIRINDYIVNKRKRMNLYTCNIVEPINEEY